MNITYVVDIDLTPALDEHRFLNEHDGKKIMYAAMNAAPTGAAVRLRLGDCCHVFSFGQYAEGLSSASTVEISGTDPKGMREMAAYLRGEDPHAVV